MTKQKKLLLKERIPDIETAIRCLGTLVDRYPYHYDDTLFKEDVKYSFTILKKSVLHTISTKEK